MRISAIHVRALVEAVEEAGADATCLLGAVGLSRMSLDDAYGWFDESVLDHLMALAPSHTGNPAFGLRWGERSAMMRYDLVAMLAGAHAPTLRQTIASLLRLLPVLGERPELTLVEDGATATLRFDPLGESQVGRRVRAEFATVGLARFLRYASAGASDVIRRVRYAHARPSYADAYARIFGGRVHFSQRITGLELERAWLDRPLPSHNPDLHAALAAQADQVLARVAPNLAYTERVRRHLATAFPHLPEMRESAKALAMSERSLRRRLAEEGSSFSQIAQEARCIAAQRLLHDATRQVQEVAFEAGFDSPTAFHRAFRRWTGLTPLQFRAERLRAEPTDAAKSRR